MSFRKTISHIKPFRFFTPPQSIGAALKDLKTKPASHWEKLGERRMLGLFKYVYKTVPAYQKFLKEHDIDGHRVKTMQDFKSLPVIDKDSYLKKYEYHDLFPNRDLSNVTTISATSGSTGEPFYFPRGEEQDAQYEYVAEIFMKNQFEIDKKSTLGVIGFGLGIWIGGIFTYKNFNRIAAKGYRLSLAPVGTNVDLFLKTLKKIALFYDQILLMGYPPFVKDVIDEAGNHGINWKDYDIKVLMAAEGFSEKFRSYLAKKAYLTNPFKDTINVYGTVEFGTMAHETALTNLIRTLALGNKKVFQAIFPKANRLPTLVQYHPPIVNFETINDEVVATGYGCTIPLVRYRFPDIGGVIQFDNMVVRLKEQGIDIYREAKAHGIGKTILRLPFVYVYERSDHAIIIRGVNIYAEEVRHALQNEKLEEFITGKFSMERREDKRMNEYFEVNVELKNGINATPNLEKQVQEIVVETLRKINSEYNDQYQSVPHLMSPPIILWPYQHPTHFKVGGKQKWVKK
ncbi:MAG: phenylacetate--CoA ligase family protein [Parcubacteria group bacterium]|nr:phenylacetate--CoA ligase family protein [Parcubacteria group bacterium]